MTRPEQAMPMLRDKLCSAAEAVAQIPDGATVACGGFVGAAHPESLTRALECRFLSTGQPRHLTLVYAAGQGDGSTRGLNHLAHETLVQCVIGGHWGLAPRLGEMALADQIHAYNFPQGVLCHLFRDIAAGRPGCITKIGLNTFIDPHNQGGCLNATTPRNRVARIELEGETYLFYKSFPIDVALIRGTAVDRRGNLSMHREALIGEVLPLAQAAHNRGGLVIAQVSEVDDSYFNPHHVRVPGVLIDAIVVAPDADHPQTFAEHFNADYCSAGDVETSDLRLPQELRYRIAARACDELRPGDVVNLGIGLPEGIASVAAQRGLLSQLTLTLESGPTGGLPAGGLSFGAARFPHAIIDQPAQFDFYDGGGLDFAALGAAQIDQYGNVNVSRFGRRLAGVGGFVNIAQNARRIAFCSTLTTDGLHVACEGDHLRVLQEGKTTKFVAQVEQISFHGPSALERHQEILYITERAVFALRPQGVELIEVARGVDVERDIVQAMGFRPLISTPRAMAVR